MREAARHTHGSTPREQFAAMHAQLLELGADQHVVEGVIAGKTRAHRALYRAHVEPPVIVQVIDAGMPDTGRGNVTATITHLGMSSAQSETPLVASGRVTTALPENTDDAYTSALLAPIAQCPPVPAEAYMAQAYTNVTSFTPHA
jgi:hypothetical protein